MNRLARYVDNEFTRNSWFFAQAETGMINAIDFIEYILSDKNIVNLTESEIEYINRVRKCYSELEHLTKRMKEEIENYRQAFYDAFLD